MVTFRPSPAPEPSDTYTNMKGDVDAIGAHCQMAYCNVLDFLPFRCESCRGTFCLDHRTEHAHNCKKAGEWARKRHALEASQITTQPKPSIYNHEQQCAETTCKTLLNPSRPTSVHCTTCNRHYCLKHRMGEDHDCKNLIPIGARPPGLIRERGKTALMKLKEWSANKMVEDSKKKKSTFGISLGSRASSEKAKALVAMNEMKKTAKGDASIPQDKRVYLLVEASADTTKAKYPTGKFFYNKEWTVGRVLDVAAKALQVENVNNRGGGEEDKLRIFHVEGGRLLKYSEKIGAPCVNGNMIVLLRGVGSGEVDLIDL